MLDISRITRQKLATEPYAWAAIEQFFAPKEAAALAASFPTDNFKDVAGYDGEKGYKYRARPLILMDAEQPSHVDGLSVEWRSLAADLLSPSYRQAVMKLTGLDLRDALLEANVTEYPPDAWLGPHVDLREKLVTHVLYFNSEWSEENGGCLGVLASSNPTDVVYEVTPVVGNSIVLVRSDKSWHQVARVKRGYRRAVNVIFHAPGSISTMWPSKQPKSWRATLRALQRKINQL